MRQPSEQHPTVACQLDPIHSNLAKPPTTAAAAAATPAAPRQLSVSVEGHVKVYLRRSIEKRTITASPPSSERQLSILETSRDEAFISSIDHCHGSDLWSWRVSEGDDGVSSSSCLFLLLFHFLKMIHDDFYEKEEEESCLSCLCPLHASSQWSQRVKVEQHHVDDHLVKMKDFFSVVHHENHDVIFDDDHDLYHGCHSGFGFCHGFGFGSDDERTFHSMDCDVNDLSHVLFHDQLSLEHNMSQKSV
jgi:hypothetical protein